MPGTHPLTPPPPGRAAPRVRQRLGALLAIFLGALLVAACSAAGGAPASPRSGPATPPTASATATVTPGPTQPAWPLTVTDDEGTRVTLPAEPKRIVSLTPAETETLFAIGVGSRIVGNTNADDYPAQAKRIPHVASYQGVVMEKLVAARPDLVIAGGNDFTAPADVARIRGLGIPVVVVYAKDVPGVLADIRLTGLVSGAYPQAVALASAMQARMDAITAAADAAGGRPRTFYEIGASPDIYGPADDSFPADMVTRAGGTPITTGSATSFTIPLERLVAADPQVIVLGDADYGTTVAQVLARPGWSGMTAVRGGAIRPVDDTIVTRPGPRLADGLAALAEAIHPGLVLPASAAAGGSAAP